MSGFRTIAALTWLLPALVACSSSESPAPEEGPEADARRRLLVSLGEECILPLYERFADRAEVLGARAEAFSESLQEADRDAVREAWGEAVDVWQHAELFQFGPAAVSTLPGGQDFRDNIYSWATVSACRVDQTTLDEGYTEGLEAGLITTRGLDAIEYLLFTEAGDEGQALNECPDSNLINRDDPSLWSEVDSDELWQRRADYAAQAALDVAAQAEALLAAWRSSGGDFLSDLSAAGQGSATYATTQSAMNALYGGMFYMDTVAKDAKLGRPIGEIDCEGGLCAFESPFARRNKSHLTRNIDTIREIVLGCNDSAYAFDDLLSELDASGPAETLDAQFEDALEALSEVEEENLDQAFEDDPASLTVVFERLTEAVKTMKDEFAAAAGLELPSGGPTDAD